MQVTRYIAAAALVLPLTLSHRADAKPIAPALFCESYPTSPACSVGTVECSFCHVRSEQPATWNAYGDAIRASFGSDDLSDDAYRAGFPDVVATVAALDSDGDGTSNEDEIFAGTLPGDEKSVPAEASCPDDPSRYDYRVCQVDYRYLLRKVSIDFCGVSPTLGELDAIAAVDDEQASNIIDVELDMCMHGEHFRGPDGVVWKLAHRKIKPLSSIKSGDDPGVIPLADYEPDYALFVHTQLDDHDAREVLTANYFVKRTPPAADGEASTYAEVANLAGQLVTADRRAGMITSAWFLVNNVMFTALPRTAAAQFYRAYLGHDIAREQGLSPIDNEPKDYDGKGVTQPTCAACHSTLDPLSYPYRNYNGLGNGGRGKYVTNRIEKFFADDAPSITDIPEAGALLGQPEPDLVSMAKAAADTDDFAAATVMDYWVLTFGAPPTAAQNDAFTALVASLKNNGYSVSHMLHDLVHSEAYGAP